MSDDRRSAAIRPESTIVDSFSADLDSMFGLSSGNGVDALSQTVEAKKQTVTSAEQALQELEAKLRETEQRLARVSRGNSPARPANSLPVRSSPDTAQAGAGAGIANTAAATTSPLAQEPTYPDDRPPTGGRPQNTRGDTQTMMAGMPGAMPQTPGEQHSGSSEYVMVDSRPER